jgi:hypothetical protein
MFGGSNTDTLTGFAVDPAGNMYAGGTTSSTDYPTTSGAMATANTPAGFGTAGFITKIDPTGANLVYSTYLPGNNVQQNGLAVDATGSAAVVGQVGEGGLAFPLINPIQSSTLNTPNAGFVVKMRPDGSAPLFSSYLGSFSTTLNAIALDELGNAFVTGASIAFPITEGESCPNLNSCGSNNSDAVVAKVQIGQACEVVASQFSVTRGPTRYINASQLFLQTVTVTNSGGAEAGPVNLVLTNLGSNASLANASGRTSCNSPGSPYVTVLASGTFAPGQSIQLQLEFSDPSKAGISYGTTVLAGAGQQ